MGHVFPPFAAGGGSPYAPYTPQPAPPASSQYPLHPAAPPPPPHQVAAGPPPPRHPSHGHHPITGQPPSQQQQQQPLPRVPHLDTQSPGMIQHCSPPHSGIHCDICLMKYGSHCWIGTIKLKQYYKITKYSLCSKAKRLSY